jgi:hypothetical protein
LAHPPGFQTLGRVILWTSERRQSGAAARLGMGDLIFARAGEATRPEGANHNLRGHLMTVAPDQIGELRGVPRHGNEPMPQGTCRLAEGRPRRRDLLLMSQTLANGIS